MIDDKNQSKTAILLLGLLVLILSAFSFSSAMGTSCNRTPAAESTPRDESRIAFMKARRFISAQLRAPASAKFCSHSEVRVARSENNEYVVSGYVDAQNVFGVMLRSPFNGPSVGPNWGYEEHAPWVPFTFGVPFEIRGDLHTYRSEGVDSNNLLMHGMEVFDSEKRCCGPSEALTIGK